VFKKFTLSFQAMDEIKEEVEENGKDWLTPVPSGTSLTII